MDYMTKPLSRGAIRMLSKAMRSVFDVPETGPFPALQALEKVPDVFRGSNIEVVEDNTLPPQTMARCFSNSDGGYTIQIKASIYNGAYEKHIGAYLGFIVHEICHVFLFWIGFTPVYNREFTSEEKIPAYRSVEWQSKALAGELMIPYEESRGLNADEIVERYNVSKAFAKYRLTH